jgi:hypothetical protein
MRPANFMLTAHVAKLGHPDGTDPKRFQLIAPYESDARRWLTMCWVNQYSGESYRISTARSNARTARVKSYRDVLQDYRFHPEPKSAAPDGAPSDRQTIGLLGRRSVRAAHVLYVGKESNHLEAVEAGLVHDAEEVVAVYRDADAESWEREILPRLKRIPCKQLAEAAGVSERTIKRIRNGHQKPSRAVLAALTRYLHGSSVRRLENRTDD